MNDSPADSETRAASLRFRAGWTFVLGGAWIIALLVLWLILLHVTTGPNGTLLRATLLFVFAFAGFYWIALRRVPTLRALSAIGFVRRPSAGRELALGTAIGWAVALALVLPALLTGNLHTLLSPDSVHAGQSLSGLLLTVLFAATAQLITSGLVFRALVQATSPGRAVLAVVLLTGVSQLSQPAHDQTQALFSAAASIIFSLAALRTRAVWVGLGLQAGWGAALTLLFGVGSFYWPASGGLVTSYVTGMRWLTGSSDGPETSLWALLVVALACIAVWRTTRDYAWHYTFDPIEGAAAPVVVIPHGEHARMEEQAAARPVPLVQIQPSVSAPQTVSDTLTR